jgi:two-component system, LytTR family, sensor kinase
MPKEVLIQLIVVLLSTLLLGVAILILSIYKRIFLFIRNEWLRMNVVVLSVALLIMAALLALQSPETLALAQKNKSILGLMLKQLGQAAIIVFFVFNVTRLVSKIKKVKELSFLKHHAVIILSIVLSALFIYGLINYVDSGMKFKQLHATLVFAYYNSLLTGFIYTSVSYVNMERKRKLDEKELELTRLQSLKNKAELDALHSKINPHFLYNALNSIADLAITDGQKGRKMTIALADLFRYSINYSNHNYSTIADEVEMAEVYLQIEKIRFEDQLNYTIQVDQRLNHYLVPRFILQPIVENAVKHGLKATGRLTEISIRIVQIENDIHLSVADNGPAFPDELTPGYGVKSVFDKLDLLFPNQYEVRFINEPVKQVSVYIQKMMKDEPID